MTIAEYKSWCLQNPKAAFALKELVFKWRGSRATLKGREGHYAAYPVRTWEQIFRVSRRTVFRIFNALEASGFLERAGFHKFNGNVNHAFVRPTQLGLEAVAASKKRIKEGTLDGTLAVAEFGALVGTLDGTLLPLAKPLSFKTTKPHAGAGESALPESAIDCKEEHMAKKLHFETVAEVGQSGSFENPKPNTEAALFKVWRDTVLETTDLNFVNLGDTEKKRLADTRKLLGKIPAGEVIHFTIKNWAQFITVVKYAAGVYTAPELPNVMFYTKHAVIAANLYLKDKEAKAAKPAAAKKPVEPENVMTTDELEAFDE